MPRELITAGANTIFFFDELYALLAAGPNGGAHEITMLLKPALLSGEVRCIASATPEEYRAAIKKARWLERCFLAVNGGAGNRSRSDQVLRHQRPL